MGCAADILHTACGQLLHDIKLIHDEEFMMNMFDDIANKIPKFKEFLKYESNNKKTEFISASQIKSVLYS